MLYMPAVVVIITRVGNGKAEGAKGGRGQLAMRQLTAPFLLFLWATFSFSVHLTFAIV